MKKINNYIVGIVVLSSVFFSLQSANAWVAARGGYGGRGFVAGGGYHGGFYHGWDYHGGGCYGCGAAGLAIGAMAGAAIVNASRPSTVYVQQPAVVVQQPATVVSGNYPIGTQFATLPAGARSMVVNGGNYYQDGSVWYKPYFGSSGVYYEVVPAP